MRALSVGASVDSELILAVNLENPISLNSPLEEFSSSTVHRYLALSNLCLTRGFEAYGPLYFFCEC